jgi:hypothetical protein
MEDYENEKSEGTREIDHLIICIHGWDYWPFVLNNAYGYMLLTIG